MKYDAKLVENCGHFVEASILPIYTCRRIMQNLVSALNHKKLSLTHICVLKVYSSRLLGAVPKPMIVLFDCLKFFGRFFCGKNAGLSTKQKL